MVLALTGTREGVPMSGCKAPQPVSGILGEIRQRVDRIFFTLVIRDKKGALGAFFVYRADKPFMR
jgi:hypothetical protein